MESKTFSDLPVSKNINGPKLSGVIKYVKDPLTFYCLKSLQKGSGVMCIEFLIRINYLGILHKNSLIPYFSNHLLNSGSFSYNEFEISQKIQSLGAHVKYETNRMYSIVSVYFISNQINKILPVISDLLVNPLYPDKVINDRIKNEKDFFLINLEKLSNQSRRKIKQVLYGESHPYGKPVIASDFDNVNSKDLISFHSDIYNSDNLDIIISGDFSDNVIDLVNYNFSKIKYASSNYKLKEQHVFNDNKNILSPPFSSPQSFYLSKKGALQTALRIAKILPGPNHIDFFGLRILVIILGGYFGSRLMTNIREEKGYTYGIGAYLIVEENYSELHIVTEVGEKYTQLTVNEIIKEMQKLKNKEISNEELKKVKAYILGSLLHNCDGIFNQALLFRNLKKHDSSFEYVHSFIDEINNITKRKIIQLANKYFVSDSFSFVACGPPERKLW